MQSNTAGALTSGCSDCSAILHVAWIRGAHRVVHRRGRYRRFVCEKGQVLRRRKEKRGHVGEVWRRIPRHPGRGVLLLTPDVIPCPPAAKCSAYAFSLPKYCNTQRGNSARIFGYKLECVRHSRHAHTRHRMTEFRGGGGGGRGRILRRGERAAVSGAGQ